MLRKSITSGLAIMAALAAAPAIAQNQTTSDTGTTQVVIYGQARAKPSTPTPPPLELYAKPAKYEHVALSADGDVFAFVTTVDDTHILATYRFSDQSKRAVKLTSGKIAAISFADDDHILVTTSRTGPRGTCGSAGDSTASDRALSTTYVRAPTQQMGASVLHSMADPSGATEANITAALLDSLKIPDCTFYGTRSQDSVTSVDMNAQTGVSLGEHMSENANLPLGTPQMATIDGKALLAGPFLELRAQTVNRQPTERVYLWAVDPATGIGRMIDDHGGDLDREARYVDDWVVTPQGEPVARATYDLTTTVFDIEMKKGGKWNPILTRRIESRDHTFAPMLAGLGADGASVVLIDAAPGTRNYHYYSLSADGALSGPLEPDDATSDRPMFDPATGRLQGFARLGAADAYALSDPALQSLYQRALDAVDGETVHIAATAADPHVMAIYAHGGEDPGAYYRVDFTTGKSEAIGEDYADVPSDWVAYQSWFDYKAADGLDIQGLLTLPPAAKGQNLPLIVLPHDGPRGHDSDGFNWLAQALASRGYLVFQPNYRGSDGYGPDFAAAGKGELGRKMQSDISDGVRALVAQRIADASRVCIMGIGYGGYAALTAATDPSAWRCAVSINGITDLDTYDAALHNQLVFPEQDLITSLSPDPQWPRAVEANPGSPSVFEAYVGGGDRKALSPVAHAGAMSVPVLLIHDSGDSVVPFSQSQAMHEALIDAHRGADLVSVPGNDHGLDTEAARLTTLNAVMDFLAKYNPAG